MKKMNKKGFTMAELLIVVAIIAVLVAIAIPIFTAQLEKAREATDAANIRAAYAEVVAAEVSGEKGNTTETADGHYKEDVKLKQKTAGWATAPDLPANLTAESGAAEPVDTVTATITSTADGATINVKTTK